MRAFVSTCGLALVALVCVVFGAEPGRSQERAQAPAPQFRTSDRCIACHNGLMTPAGEDVSIGFDWRASMMANSSRDPYWQASVRRETIDHADAAAQIEDTCATCHMPVARHAAKLRGERGQVFAHLPFAARTDHARQAEDGVSCSLCHRIGAARLGTPESFTGGFVIDPPDAQGNNREYGPFEIDPGHTRIMKTSTEGFVPVQGMHIRQSELCATCHTLMTETLGPGGKVVGRLPEQVPYQEWLHSSYKDTQSCQSCHMPVVKQAVPVTRVFGVPRELSRHVFVAANFFMQRMLNRYREDLHVAALPQELTAAADRTERYLESQAALISVGDLRVEDGRLKADVVIDNLGGHKLPTAMRRRFDTVRERLRSRRFRTLNGSIDLPDGAQVIRKMPDAGDDAVQFQRGHLAGRVQGLVPAPRCLTKPPAQRGPLGLGDRGTTPARRPVSAAPGIGVAVTPAIHQVEPVTEVIHMGRNGRGAWHRRPRCRLRRQTVEGSQQPGIPPVQHVRRVRRRSVSQLGEEQRE